MSHRRTRRPITACHLRKHPDVRRTLMKAQALVRPFHDEAQATLTSGAQLKHWRRGHCILVVTARQDEDTKQIRRAQPGAIP